MPLVPVANLLQVVLDWTGGGPDPIMNVLWYSPDVGTDPNDPIEHQLIADDLTAAVTASGSFSSVFAGPNLRFTFRSWDVTSPVPNVIDTTPAGLSPTALPRNLALVATLRAGGGKSRQGRMYLGPLRSACLDSATGRCANVQLTNLRQLANNFANAGNSMQVVYSRKNNTFAGPIIPTVDDRFDHFDSRKA